MATAYAERRAVPTRSRFYLWMAGAVVIIAFGGFLPSYWSKMAAGTFTGQPVMHLHGALFFTWTLLYFSQSALVAAGRTPDHRKWGMFGIFLVGMMAVSVPLAVINEIWVAERISPAAGDLARQFVIVPIFGLVLFVGFFGLAIGNVQRPEIHKRLMLLMQVPLMHAAAGRVAAILASPGGVPAGPAPGAFVTVPPGLVVDLLIVVAMVHDWRTLGRVHRVFVIGLPVIVAQQLLLVPISTTPGWLAFASWLEHLAR